MATPSARISSAFISLKNEIQNIKQLYQELKLECILALEENKRLLNEQKENENRVSISGFCDNSFINQKIDNIFKLQNVTHAKIQSFINQCKTGEETGLDSLDALLHESQSQYALGIEVLLNKLQESQTVIQCLEQDVQKLRNELAEHKIIIKECNGKLQGYSIKVQQVKQNEMEWVDMVNSYKCDLERFKKKNEILEKKINELTINNEELLKKNKILKQDNDNMCEDFRKIEDSTKKCVLTTEDAILQKRMASYREQQAHIKVNAITKNVDENIRKLHLSHRCELEKMGNEHGNAIQALLKKIHFLEDSVHEKEIFFERVKRDKNRLESKIEVYKKSSSEHSYSSKEYSDLQTRLESVKKERDEAVFQLNVLQGDSEFIKKMQNMEIEGLTMQKASLEKTIEMLRIQFDELSHNKTSDNVLDVLQLKCCNLEEENENLQMEIFNLNKFSATLKETAYILMMNIEKYKQRILYLEKVLDQSTILRYG